MSDIIRRLAIGISTEALCEAWARQEHAPAGSVQILGREIAGRVRNGHPWTVLPALAASVVTRPNLDPTQAEIAWMAASLAASDALGDLGIDGTRCLWPDVVVGADSEEIPLAVVTAKSHLGPGVVEFCVLTVRFDLSRVAVCLGRDAATELEEWVARRLRQQASLLDDPQEVCARYTARCSTLGRAWHVNLLPKGYTRGVATTIDDRGSLIIESGTGMREVVIVDSLKNILPVS